MRGYELDPHSTTAEMVFGIEGVGIEGNILPMEWLKHLKTKAGKPYTVAAVILADIVYWYRPIKERDEATGEALPFRKKFAADKLQRSYGYFVDLYGFGKDQVREACYYLRDQGLIQLELRTVEYQTNQHDSRIANNVLYIGLNWRAVQRISQDIDKNGHPIGKKTDRVLGKKPIPSPEKNGHSPLKKTDTNTETTPQTTPESTTEERGAVAPPAPVSLHSSIEAVKELTNYYPLAAVKLLILERAIDTPEKLSFWRQVITHYVATYGNPRNIKAMLEFYDRRELPTTQPTGNGRSNGERNYDWDNDPSVMAFGKPKIRGAAFIPFKKSAQENPPEEQSTSPVLITEDGGWHV